MESKIIYSALASLLFVQAAYSQCDGNLGNLASINNIGLGNNLINSGAIISNNNLGLGGASIITNNLGLVGNSGYSNSGIFGTSSGSPAYNYPGGVLISSENQLGGQIAVGGNVPFLGSSYFGGEIPSAGEGVLTYSAGPSVSLNGGGCGYGQGYGQGLSSFSLGGASIINNGLGASAINSGFGGASIINNGFVGTGLGCGCGIY